jgi:hypothetical protein
MDIENGFLKINFEGFYKYLNKIGDVVDIFYKKSPLVNFTTQNHKIMISAPDPRIKKIEIDNKSIFLNYSKDCNQKESVEYFVNIVDEIFNSVKFKCSDLVRIGHANQYIEYDKNEIQSIKSQIFSSDKANIINFNDLTFEIDEEDKIKVQKTLGTPIDTKTGQNVISMLADYYSIQNISYSSMKDFLEKSITYFENKELKDGQRALE